MGMDNGENYSNSALIIVVTVFMLAIFPVLGLVGVTIAGVVSESRRHKREQPLPFAPPQEMLWQPPPPQYNYGAEMPQYPEPPQYPEENRTTTKE
jgi:hypothetical protein